MNAAATNIKIGLVSYEIESVDGNGILWLFRNGKRGGKLAGRWICRADGAGFRRVF